MIQASQYSSRIGAASAAGAYFLWGLLPIYWKWVHQVPAHEILAHRILWSFVFMVVIIVSIHKKAMLLREVRQLRADPKRIVYLVVASLLISVNWLTYIWAVNDNRIVETSFGYYINPLVSVLLGIVVLKERLSFWQMISFFLAVCGVLNMAFHMQSMPWVALVLAVTFGLYGLCKKMVNVGAITSITLETLLVAPLSFLYILYLTQQGMSSLTMSTPIITGLLVGAGVVTAVPLLLFAHGANHLPLTIMGFIQYLSPTIALLVGVFLYHEPFTAVHLVSFSFIWLALFVFSLAQTRPFVQLESMFMRRVIKKSEAS